MKSYLQELFPDIGWEKLLHKLTVINTELMMLPSYKGISSIERHNGMMKIVFEEVPAYHAMFVIQDAIAYKFERLSARMCEDCGQFGLRRTELKETRTLCTEHYALRYSEEHPVPSMVANPEPHTDY
jgi:hypothetical protein